VCRNDNYAYSLHVARSTHTLCICVVLFPAMRDMHVDDGNSIWKFYSLVISIVFDPLLFSRYRSLSPLSRKVLICVTCEILYYKVRRRDTSAT
jgi:hypothetical protein